MKWGLCVCIYVISILGPNPIQISSAGIAAEQLCWDQMLPYLKETAMISPQSGYSTCLNDKAAQALEKWIGFDP